MVQRSRGFRTICRLRAGVVLLLIAACAAPARPRVERPEELPTRRYPVTSPVGRLVVDATAFAPLASRLRTDLESDAAKYDIRAPAILKERLFLLALLDALDDRWADAIALLDRIVEIEPKPADKAMTGLTIRVWADAIAHGGDLVAFRAALDRKLATMPLDLVRPHLSALRTMGQVFTPDFCRDLVDKEIGPQITDGTVSLEQAEAITFQRYAVLRLAPVGAILDESLAARGIEPLE
jgi:hypothetical protein